MNPERGGLVPECLAIDRIAITDEKTGSIVCPARLQKLPGCPRRRWMFCDIEVENPSTIMTQDDQHE